MMRQKMWARLIPVGGLVLSLGVLAACGGTSSSPSPKPAAGSSTLSHKSKKQTPPAKAIKPQSPVPVESNPPGDIPDSTAFVPYDSSAGHFAIKVPEGWSRTNKGSSVTFTSKLNSVSVIWHAAASAPSPARVKSSEIPTLKRTVPAFKLEGLNSVSLPGGKAVMVHYQANSKPNAVTGKRYRLDLLRFEFFRGGREADLILSSPVGSDNVDPWRIVSQSFMWK